MIYLISKIVLCLVVAFLLGMLVGWFLFKLVAEGASDPDADQLRRDLDESLSRQRTMETALDDYENKIAELKGQLEATTEVPAVARIGPETVARAFDPSAETAKPRPLETDDLQAIKGIGPVIEKKLNAAGIRSYRQIAEMKTSDVERLAAAIEFFPDRIRRDDWIRQASDLHVEKYGN